MSRAENILMTVTIVHFGMFAWFVWLWLANSKIQRYQRSIEASRHEAIVHQLNEIFARLDRS